MNLDDKSLFLGAMEDVQPLKRNNDVHWHPERKTRAVQRVDTLQLDNFLTTGYLDIVPLATALEFKREGLQSGVLEKLRRGKYGQQASLNLLRQPVEKCRQMLFAFVVQGQKEGLRNLLIVHGKGRDDNAHANIIRSYLARWLVELPEVRRSARRYRTTAAAAPATWRYENRPRLSWRTGSATPSAAASASAALIPGLPSGARVIRVRASPGRKPARRAPRRSAPPESGPGD